MAKYTIDNLPIVKGKYKVIALDLDDTLLHSDKSISENTIKTLQKAQSQGFQLQLQQVVIQRVRYFTCKN